MNELRELVEQARQWVIAMGPIRVAIGAVALGVAVSVLRRVLAPRSRSPHLTLARCHQCGWAGEVSRHKPVCPRCGSGISL